ncbi:MAG: hypothetical protein ACQEXI_01095 [Pseudomonadota bacterium]
MYKTTTAIFTILLSGNVLAMDYSHPFAPSNTTECVKYTTMVLDNVEQLIENDFDRDVTASELFKIKEDGIRSRLDKSDEDMSQKKEDLYVEYMRLLINDVITWYRSAKYSFDPRFAYETLLADCEIGIVDAEMEEMKRSME